MNLFLFHFQFVFYAVWAAFFVFRYVMSLIIAPDVVHVDYDHRFLRRSVVDNIITIFSFHWQIHDTDSTMLKKRKRIYNRLTIPFVLYTAFTFFLWIYSFPLSHKFKFSPHPRTYFQSQNETRKIRCANKYSAFGINYNKERVSRGMIQIPASFCQSDASDANSEEWINFDVENKQTFHDRKLVFVNDGRWVGEEDLFVNIVTAATLSVNAEFVDNELKKEFRLNGRSITEYQFDSILTSWNISIMSKL